MKIVQYGTVTLTEGPVKVEGWTVEREPEDPADATDEQLLLACAIHWAQERFKVVLQNEQMNAFRKLVLAKLPKMKEQPN